MIWNEVAKIANWSQLVWDWPFASMSINNALWLIIYPVLLRLRYIEISSDLPSHLLSTRIFQPARNGFYLEENVFIVSLQTEGDFQDDFRSAVQIAFREIATRAS